MEPFKSNEEVSEYILNRWIDKERINLQEFINFLGCISLNNSRINRRLLIDSLVDINMISFLNENEITFNFQSFINKNDLIQIEKNIHSYLDELEEYKNYPLIFICKKTFASTYNFLELNKFENTYTNIHSLYSALRFIDTLHLLPLESIWNNNFAFIILRNQQNFKNKIEMYEYLVNSFFKTGATTSEKILEEINRLIPISKDQILIKKIIEGIIEQNENDR
ncbi:hypothetical protein SERIO_v1c09310 [Spiroplasma eriocheiris]|uniref:Uncharacterized protein n=2 Tax=Spiroplasma eriocheiris TaxID=315358 RepID=A0A0H3XKN5_9MOLU|nr:hypothetical protein SERIO_v1c09310 [Spiroplasma eriocheiris]